MTSPKTQVDRRRMLVKTGGAFAGLLLLTACGPGVALGRRRNAIVGPPGHRRNGCKDLPGHSRGRGKCDDGLFDLDVDVKIKTD